MGRAAVINLDTNILVRLVVHDDPQQSALVRRFIAESLSTETPGYVTTVAAIEFCWVLESIYGLSHRQIAEALRSLLTMTDLRVQNSAAVLAALSAYDDGIDDIADALIASLGEAAGCTETVTFDRRFARQKGVRLLR
jgi:predicted nucleic-acid-binding protein